MVFIFNKSLDQENCFNNELRKVYGINFSKKNYFFKRLGYNLIYKYSMKIMKLNNFSLKLSNLYKNHNFFLGLSLKQKNFLSIKKEIDINSYKGFRHRDFYPVRGQRTHTNSKTCKRVNYRSLSSSF